MPELSLTQWKDLSETAEHLMVALGVLIGGGWTLYTFIRLKMVANARLKLEEKIEELHKSAVLDATISARQIAVGTETDFYISALVSIINVGTTDTAINYSDVEFFVCEANIDPQGVMHYVNVASGSYPYPQKLRPIGTTVPLKFTFRVPYVVKVRKAGLYLMTFKAKYTGEDNLSLAKIEKEIPKCETFCTAYSYIAVK